MKAYFDGRYACVCAPAGPAMCGTRPVLSCARSTTEKEIDHYLGARVLASKVIGLILALSSGLSIGARRQPACQRVVTVARRQGGPFRAHRFLVDCRLLGIALVQRCGALCHAARAP